MPSAASLQMALAALMIGLPQTLSAAEIAPPDAPVPLTRPIAQDDPPPVEASEPPRRRLGCREPATTFRRCGVRTPAALQARNPHQAGCRPHPSDPKPSPRAAGNCPDTDNADTPTDPASRLWHCLPRSKAGRQTDYDDRRCEKILRDPRPGQADQHLGHPPVSPGDAELPHGPPGGRLDFGRSRAGSPV